MAQATTKQKGFVVFLQTSSGGIKQVNVRASTAQVAAARAEKRNPGCRSTRVEKIQ